MCHGLELLGQRFRGHIHCAVFCELALCQSNAPEAISIVLYSVVPGLLGLRTISVPHRPDGSVCTVPVPSPFVLDATQWTDGGQPGLHPLLDGHHGDQMVCTGKHKSFFPQYRRPMATTKTLATVLLISRKIKKLVLFPPFLLFNPSGMPLMLSDVPETGPPSPLFQSGWLSYFGHICQWHTIITMSSSPRVPHPRSKFPSPFRPFLAIQVPAWLSWLGPFLGDTYINKINIRQGSSLFMDTAKYVHFFTFFWDQS